MQQCTAHPAVQASGHLRHLHRRRRITQQRDSHESPRSPHSPQRCRSTRAMYLHDLHYSNTGISSDISMSECMILRRARRTWPARITQLWRRNVTMH